MEEGREIMNKIRTGGGGFIIFSRTNVLCAGCMAERLKTQLLDTDKMVDVVAGPGEEWAWFSLINCSLIHICHPFRCIS